MVSGNPKNYISNKNSKSAFVRSRYFLYRPTIAVCKKVKTVLQQLYHEGSVCLFRIIHFLRQLTQSTGLELINISHHYALQIDFELAGTFRFSIRSKKANGFWHYCCLKWVDSQTSTIIQINQSLVHRAFGDGLVCFLNHFLRHKVDK